MSTDQEMYEVWKRITSLENRHHRLQQHVMTMFDQLVARAERAEKRADAIEELTYRLGLAKAAELEAARANFPRPDGGNGEIFPMEAIRLAWRQVKEANRERGLAFEDMLLLQHAQNAFMAYLEAIAYDEDGLPFINVDDVCDPPF